MYDAIADGYASLLLREDWHWFANLTFRPELETTHGGVHPEKASKAFRYWISKLNRALWGPNWAKRRSAHGGLIWARGQEFHKDGRIHFHAVMSSPTGDLNKQFSRLDAMQMWFKDFGIARIFRPEKQGDVCAYVSKYVVKGGEVDVSLNFGSVRSAPLDLDGLGLGVPKPATSRPPATDGQPRSGSAQSRVRKPVPLALALLDPTTMPARSRNDENDDDDNEADKAN